MRANFHFSCLALILAFSIPGYAGEKKKTKSGAVFTLDTSHPKLGIAWRDPSGMIWGDIVKKGDGSGHYMKQKEATEYCSSIGAVLPSREDFIRLREYMGAKPGGCQGYEAQILPDLYYTVKGEAFAWYFWSSSVHPEHAVLAYGFNGRVGSLVYGNRDVSDDFIVWFRCVVPASTANTKKTTIGQVVTRDTSHPKLSEELPDPTVNTKKTTTGQVFIRDTSHPKLGEAWRDPSGMIWGDIAKNDDGSPRRIKHRNATEYCKSIGAELPSREDYVRLREYLGAEPGGYAGFTPQVLPNFIHVKKGVISSRYFWSSSVHPKESVLAIGFNGRVGGIGYINRVVDDDFIVWVRCVVRP